MRTSRMRRVPRCRISTWPWVTRSGRSAACATSGASSGITAVSGRPSTPSSGKRQQLERRAVAARDRCRLPSTLSTPAETPASTASVSRRRVSSSSVGVDQFAALLLDLAGHAVERARELAQLVVGRPLLHARRQVAAAHPLGCRHQPADRLGQARGEQDGQPHRRQQHQEGDGAADQEDDELAALHAPARSANRTSRRTRCS